MYAVLPLWEQKTVKLHANGHIPVDSGVPTDTTTPNNAGI